MLSSPHAVYVERKRRTEMVGSRVLALAVRGDHARAAASARPVMLPGGKHVHASPQVDPSHLFQQVDDGDVWEAPAWSPDGTRLAVVGRDGDTSNLYTVSSDGSQLTRLTNDGAYYYSPDWSPDGTKIVCARWTTEGWNVDVYVMDADGSDLEQLTDWRGWDSGPIWSPDGNEILFTSDRGASPAELESQGLGGVQGLAIYVMEADGGDVRLVFDDGAMQDSPTSWR